MIRTRFRSAVAMTVTVIALAACTQTNPAVVTPKTPAPPTLSAPKQVAVGENLALEVTLSGQDGSLSRLETRWGDDSPMSNALLDGNAQHTFTHQYSEAKAYRITVTVYNQTGQSSEANIDLEVVAANVPSNPGEPNPGNPDPGEPNPGEPGPGEPTPNRPPTAQDFTMSADTQRIYDIDLGNRVRDEDGDTLSLVAVGTTSLQNTKVEQTGALTLRYTTGNTVGEDTFTYTVSDGKGGLATGTVRVTINLKVDFF